MNDINKWQKNTKTKNPVVLNKQVNSNIVGWLQYLTPSLTIIIPLFFLWHTIIYPISEYFINNAPCYENVKKDTVIIECNKAAVKNITMESIKYTKKGFILIDEKLIDDKDLMYFTRK